jgi:hypothetical protein
LIQLTRVLPWEYSAGLIKVHGHFCAASESMTSSWWFPHAIMCYDDKLAGKLDELHKRWFLNHFADRLDKFWCLESEISRSDTIWTAWSDIA